jgi:ankyrin repeat protein
LSIYYLNQNGVDINIRDVKNSTPLHWACYTRSEIAIGYILSMRPDIEAQDIQGFTPLHIAVPGVLKLGSTRSVKALLLKGANRDATDKKGKMPIDMIPPNLEENLIEELETYLGDQKYCECLMLTVPLIPLKRNVKTQFLFMSLFVVVLGLNLAISLPTIHNDVIIYF